MLAEHRPTSIRRQTVKRYRRFHRDERDGARRQRAIRCGQTRCRHGCVTRRRRSRSAEADHAVDVLRRACAACDFTAAGEGTRKGARARQARASPDAVASRRCCPSGARTRRNAILRATPSEFSGAEREALLTQVLAMLDDKRFAELFLPGSRAEVPIVGRFAGRPLLGPGGPPGGDAASGADRRLQDQQSGSAAARGRPAGLLSRSLRSIARCCGSSTRSGPSERL